MPDTWSHTPFDLRDRQTVCVQIVSQDPVVPPDVEAESEREFVALSRMRRGLSELSHHPVDLVPRDGLKLCLREEILVRTEILYPA